MKKQYGLISFLVLAFVLSGLVAMGYTDRLPNSKKGNSSSKAAIQSKAASMNLLLIGVDERKHDIGRSDTLILAEIDSVNHTITGTSIPRDSLVSIPGHGYTKINHSYGYGGPTLTRDIVEDTLGVRVDSYITVNFTEFEKLIDKNGGVEVTVDEDMDYDDNAGGLHIHIKKGKQTLDGETALGFVRFRHDRLGDLGRMKRQQQMLDAIVKKLTSPRMAISAIKTLEKTDFTASDLLSLWPIVKDRDRYRVIFKTAEGESKRLKSGWYYLLDANLPQVTSALNLDETEDRESEVAQAPLPLHPSTSPLVSVTPIDQTGDINETL